MPVFRSCATVFAVALRYFSPTRTEEDSFRSQWFKKILKVSCRLLFLSALFVFLSNAVFELQNLCRRQEWLSAGRPGCRLSENTARPEYSRPTTLCRSSGNKKKSPKKLCKNSFWHQNFCFSPKFFWINFFCSFFCAVSTSSRLDSFLVIKFQKFLRPNFVLPVSFCLWFFSQWPSDWTGQYHFLCHKGQQP